MSAEGRPLWHGRFGAAPADALWAYTVSLPFDRRLAPYDVKGTRAHAEGLGRAGILSEEEVRAVGRGLDVLAGELHRSTFAFAERDEDIHTAIERRLTELAGPAGAKVHTGRSRNDQVATALRLFVKDALAGAAGAVLDLQETLLRRADESGDAYLPGYTHLQQAQPVLLAHHLMAHAWAFARDVDRLLEARRRADVSPLGAGALAGSSLPLDPASTAAALGFAAVFENSLDATGDRDFVADALYALTMVAIHLSRLGEEIVLWSTAEFGFLELDDAYATGSSMLPQKKNPDVAELARGKAGRVIGDLTGFLATLKSLPLAYNRDLQEDKEPLFDALDQVTLGVTAIGGLTATARFRVDRMAAAADSPYAAATDLAEMLVGHGVPFRDAHATVGALVRRSLDEGVPLADLVANVEGLGPEARGLLAPGVAVRRRTSPGGAGPDPVATQRERLAERLRADRHRVDELQ